MTQKLPRYLCEGTCGRYLCRTTYRHHLTHGCPPPTSRLETVRENPVSPKILQPPPPSVAAIVPPVHQHQPSKQSNKPAPKRKLNNQRMDASCVRHHLCFYCGDMFTIISDFQRHLLDHQWMGVCYQIFDTETVAKKQKRYKKDHENGEIKVNEASVPTAEGLANRRHTIATSTPSLPLPVSENGTEEIKEENDDGVEKKEKETERTNTERPGTSKDIQRNEENDTVTVVPSSSSDRSLRKRGVSKNVINPNQSSVNETMGEDTVGGYEPPVKRKPSNTSRRTTPPSQEPPSTVMPSSQESTYVPTVIQPPQESSQKPPVTSSSQESSESSTITPSSQESSRTPTVTQPPHEPTPPPPSSCLRCSYEDSNATKLIGHWVNMHSADISSLTLTGIANGVEKYHQSLPDEDKCVECGIAFSSPTNYFLHLLQVHKDSLFIDESWDTVDVKAELSVLIEGGFKTILIPLRLRTG